MYYVAINKENDFYFLGNFTDENDAINMMLIAKSFSDIGIFLNWYPKRKSIYNWLNYKCHTVGVSTRKIVLAIYDGYYGELYCNEEKLTKFIDDFKDGYAAN